jgi:hypothetical protein
MTDSKEGKPPTTEELENKPRWRPKSRKRFALAKYHGISGDSWSIEQISDYLRVSESTVAKYIFDSDMGDKVAERLADVQAQTRLEVAMRMFDQLETLDEIEQKLLKEKEAVTTSYVPQTVSGVPHYQDDTFHVEDAPELEFTVPVADDFDEVPNVEQVKEVWKEKRKLIQDIEDLLGLEEPKQMEVESEHTEVTMERKVYELEGDAGLPSQEPVALGDKYDEDES